VDNCVCKIPNFDPLELGAVGHRDLVNRFDLAPM